MEELIAWDPDAEVKEARREREQRLKVGGGAEGVAGACLLVGVWSASARRWLPRAQGPG